MRAKIEKKDILPAIMRTVSIADKKSVVPILSHVLLDFNANGLTIKATDLDHSIIEKVPAQADTYGVVAVPAGTLCDILRKIPDKVTVEFSLVEKGEKLQVVAEEVVRMNLKVAVVLVVAARKMRISLALRKRASAIIPVRTSILM